MNDRPPTRRRQGGTPWPLLGVLLLAVIGAFVFWLVLESMDDGGAGPPPSATPTPIPAGTPSPSPTPELNQELLSERLTVLVMGVDLNEARRQMPDFGPNTDTIILASVSADQSEVALISLPRDTVDIPLPDGTVWERKVNAIYAERGPEALLEAMEALFAVRIDHYLALDMDDFERLATAVDGVTVDVEEPLTDPALDLDLEAGRQHLDAETALDYVRTRVDTDYGRAARQQQVLLELVFKLADPDADVDLFALLDGLESLETDLPLDELPTLLEIARRARDADVTRQVLQPPRFISFEGIAGDRGYILVPNVPEMRDYAQQVMDG